MQDAYLLVGDGSRCEGHCNAMVVARVDNDGMCDVAHFTTPSDRAVVRLCEDVSQLACLLNGVGNAVGLFDAQVVQAFEAEVLPFEQATYYKGLRQVGAV